MSNPKGKQEAAHYAHAPMEESVRNRSAYGHTNYLGLRNQYQNNSRPATQGAILHLDSAKRVLSSQDKRTQMKAKFREQNQDLHG